MTLRHPRLAAPILTVVLSGALLAQAPVQPPPLAHVDEVRRYIKQTWTTLTRSPRDLARAAPDPKLHRDADATWPVYIAADENRDEIQKRVTATLAPSDARHIELRTLPPRAEDIREHGLLYLPHAYVVPGGRFNEMYGWDSYFIQVGLLRDGEIALARDMTDNFLYEIAHYGKILNANRTYYLTRSQPPFLTQMVLGVFQRTKDRQWLREALPAIEKYYRYWTTEPHLVARTGLSRYFDLGEGPAPK